MNRLVIMLALLACGPNDPGEPQYCKDFVACSYKTGVDAGSLDSTFGPNGSCWQTLTTSSSCYAACQSGDDNFKATGVAADAGCTFGM
jgi:hypothetical protein